MISALKKLLAPFREEASFSLLALLALAVPISFWMFSYEKFETIKLCLWMVLLGSSVVVFFRWNSAARRQALPRAFWIPMALFLSWGLLASFISWDWLNSFLGAYLRFTGGFLFLALFGAFTALLLAQASRQRLVYLFNILIADSLLVAAVGILQSFGVAFYIGLDASGFLRGPSLLGNADFSTMFLAAALPLVVYFFTISRTMGLRLYYGFTALACLFCLVVLSSRGGLVAAAAGLLALCVLWLFAKNYKKAYAAAAALALLAALWLFFVPVTRPQSYAESANLSEANISLRFYVWDIARAGMFQHPFFGVGLSNFQLLFEQQRGSNLANQDGIYDDAHNLFLQLAADGGWPLLIFFLALLGCAAYRLLRRLRHPIGAEAAALLSGLFAWAVAAAFTPVSTACFLLLAVLLAAAFYQDREPSKAALPVWLKPLAIASGALLIICGLLFFAAESLFYLSYQRYYESNFRASLEFSDAAIHLNPFNQYYYIYRGASRAQLGLSAAAEQDLAKVIAMHPRDSRSYISAGNIAYTAFLATGQESYLDQATSLITGSLSYDKYYANHYGVAAALNYLDGRPQQALDLVHNSLALDPTYVPSWLLLARLEQIGGKRDQALYALNQAFTLQPDSPVLQSLINLAKGRQDIKTLFIPVGYLASPLEQ